MVLNNQRHIVSFATNLSRSPFDYPASLKLTGPIMQGTQNSPMHRSGNLLCGDLSGRAQSVNRSSLGYPPCSQSLESSSFGERASSPTTRTFMVPMLAPDRNPRMFHPMDPMASGYYADPLPMYTPNLPRSSGYYPIADSRLVADAYDQFMPTYQPLDTSVDFGGMLSEPLVAHQPPIPPAAPEQSILSNPTFHYHPCRWLGGPQCDGFAPGRNREMAEHLRASHHFIGHERDLVQCEWENCGQTMQRMNVPRHIVSRHLLAAARCRFCNKRFSRPDVVARHEKTCSGVSPVSSSSVSRV